MIEEVKIKGSKSARDLFTKEVPDTQTRTEGTESAYRKNFEWLLSKYLEWEARKHAVDSKKSVAEYLAYLEGREEDIPASARRFLAWFESRLKDWEYSTVRQFKACIKLHFGERFADDREVDAVLQRIDLISRESTKTFLKKDLPKPEKESLKKTSSKKKIHIPEKNLIALLDWVSNEKRIKDLVYRSEKENRVMGIWQTRAVLYLLAGVVTGLRPSEWIGVEKTEEDDLLYLTVKNSKNTNGRAHSDHRTIAVESDNIFRELVDLHIDQINSFCGSSADALESYQRTCNKSIKVVEAKIEKATGVKAKNFCMYTGRHQYSANLKAADLSTFEIAYLMGHASALTAKNHYARKATGYSRKKVNNLLPAIISTGTIIPESPFQMGLEKQRPLPKFLKSRITGKTGPTPGSQ